MEKILLKKRVVSMGLIIANQSYLTKKIVNSKENAGKSLEVGWSTDGECNPACPEPTTHGYYQCTGGQCVYIPY